MRKLLLSILLLSSFSAYMPTKTGCMIAVNQQIKSLIAEGYSSNWAIKKTLVENNVIKEDAEYRAIIED